MTVYFVETKQEIFWGTRKMDVVFKNVEFLYKDNARFREMTEEQFKKYSEATKKKVIQIKEQA